MIYFEQAVQNVSNFSKCSSYEIPRVQEYLKAADTYGIALISVGAVALVVSILVFIDTLRYVMHNASSRVKAYTAFVIAVHPVTCLVSYFAILVPRSHLLTEALTQGMFMAGMYQLFCLFVSYCGGDAMLVKKVKVTRLSLQVGPCCCWPCCSLLPTFKVNKKTVKYLKLLVLQLPLVQVLVYFIILVMWAEAESLYQINYLYLQPVIIVSILCGIWGMLMTIKLLRETLSAEFLLLPKFGVLQLVLIFAKAQGIITRALVWLDLLPCYPPITPQVYANLLHNTLMIMEMVLLGLIARNLYKRDLPDIDNDKPKQDNIISTVLGDTQEKRSYNNNRSEGADNLGYIM